MTDKPFTLTPEHFSSARADIARRRAKAISDFDAELAQVDADEQAVAHIAGRYPQATVALAPKSPKAPGSNAGRPYTRRDDARIAAATRGELESLAQNLGRPYPGVLKRHEVLARKQRKLAKEEPAPNSDLALQTEQPPAVIREPQAPDTVDTSRHIGKEQPPAVIREPQAPAGISATVAEIPETPASNPATIVDPTVPSKPAPATAVTRHPSPPPGRAVTGPLLDSGPSDRRVYLHPEAFFSKDGN